MKKSLLLLSLLLALVCAAVSCSAEIIPPYGEGQIGLEALRRVALHPALAGRPFILETPNDDAGYAAEIALLREMRR